MAVHPPSPLLRERAALVLVAYPGVVLLIQFVLLFSAGGGDDVDFSGNAVRASGTFVSPVLAALLVGAAVLATVAPAPPLARAVVLGSLAGLGVMAALGALTWLSALSVDGFRPVVDLGGIPLAGKLAGTFAMLLGIGLLLAAMAYVATLLSAVPRQAAGQSAAGYPGAGSDPYATRPQPPTTAQPPVPPPADEDDDRPLWRPPSG